MKYVLKNHCISFLHKVHRFTHEEIKVVHGKRIKYFALEIHHRVYVGKKMILHISGVKNTIQRVVPQQNKGWLILIRRHLGYEDVKTAEITVSLT